MLVRAEVTVVGTRPLFWNRFGTDTLPLEKKARTGVAGNDPNEWRKTYLATPDGRLYLEPSYLFGCIRTGAKFTRHLKGTLQSTVESTLQVIDERVFTNRKLPKSGLESLREADGQPVYIDVRSVTNPGTRGRNIRYRVAAAAGWEATFTIVWDDSLLSREQMEAIANDGGQFAGVGDARKIGFGRFKVTSFRMVEKQDAQKPTAKRTVGRKTR